LSKIEIAVSGEWGDVRSEDVRAVILSTREAIIEGLALPEDGPSCIRVVGDPTAPSPMVFAFDAPDGAATIRLTVQGKKWNQIAYQAGHELGHVLANNWGAKAVPQPPSHWLEEGLVEAISLFGLTRMSRQWFRSPPHQNWRTYAGLLKSYAENRLRNLREHEFYVQFEHDPAAWFANGKEHLCSVVRLDDEIWPVIPWLTTEFVRDPGLVADICALNRWPERAALPIEQYLDAWVEACESLNSIGRLPRAIRAKLGIGCGQG
jgi:hypothetical protein